MVGGSSPGMHSIVSFDNKLYFIVSLSAGV